MQHTSRILILLAWSAPCCADVPNYEEHIKPLFRDHCLKCHNADDANADLDLSSFAAVSKGGTSGVVVKAGRPESSQLYRAMAHLDGAEAMPPESPKLPESKLALVRDWIRGGLIAGKGGKSQLRSVGAMVAAVEAAVAAPMPVDLPEFPVSKTARPPVPQALAASPGAPVFAVSGQEQVLLYGGEAEEKSGEGRKKSQSTDASSPPLFHLLGALPFPEGNIHDLKFSRNGLILLAGGGRGAHLGTVVLYDVASGRRLGEIGDEVDSVLAADITVDHRFVALGGPGGIVKIFDTKSGALLHRIKKHTDWITAVSFSPDGSMLATGDRSGGIHIRETEKGAIVFTLDEHKVRIASLSWRADGKLLASAADDGNLILWDMKDGFPTRNTVAHAAKATSRYTRGTGIFAMQYAPDGRLLTSGRDGIARIWSGEGDRLLELPIAEGLPVSATWLSGGNTAIIGSFDGSLHVWDVSARARVQTLVNGATEVKSAGGER